MSLAYNVIKFTNGKSCVIFDQRTMYAVGPDSSVTPTLSVGTTYRFNDAYLFYASGGNILYMIEGTDTAGNVYKYKSESEVGAGNAGYYINNYKVCTFTPGLGGVYRVCFMIAADGTKYVIRLNWTSGDHGDFINGVNLSDEHFTDNIGGWGRMVKVNFPGSNGVIELKVNDPTGATGSNYFRVFEWGQSYTSYTPIMNLDPQPAPVDDPYFPGNVSGTGGGDRQKQNWSENSDAITLDPMPNQSNYGAVACGLVTIFHPTKPQVKKLADVLWGQGFLNFLQNLVENISDLFISFGMLPFSVTHGSAVEVTWFSYDVGGEVPIGTGIYLDLATSQWLEFDMGSISLTGSDDRIFANDTVLDYSPYSKLGIYLPFIGYQELDIDECRNTVLTLTYRIDLLSGTAVAIITSSSFGKDRALYQFTGNCLTQIPLTSMDAGTMITNAVNIGLAAASAGATEAVASAGDALAQSQFESGGGNLGVDYDRMNMAITSNAARVSNAQGSLVGATVNGVMGMKPNFKHSGGISAAASLFAVKQPYLFLTTPRQSYPDGYGRVCGFPSNIGGVLGGFPGYTVVEDIRLNNLVATSSEVEEIYQLLKSGVIV